jgi:phosphomannomutase
VHLTSALSAPIADAATVLARLRTAPPTRLAGVDVTMADDAAAADVVALAGGDVLVLAGGDDELSVRLAVRPSGTEPKIKCYLEVRVAVGDDLAAARSRAGAIGEELRADVAGLLHRGPN